MDFSWVLVHGCALFAVPVPSLKNSQLSSKCQWNKSLQLWHLRETKAFGWRGLGAGRKFFYHRTNKNYNTLIHGLRSISFSFILFLVNAIPLTSMHSSRMRTACLFDHIPAFTMAGKVYPSMHWAGVCVSQHALGRGCLPGGVCPGGCPAQGGVCLGVCLPRGGVCPEGVSAQGGVCLEVCPGCACGRHPPRPEADTPHEQNGLTDGCKKHYLAVQLRLRAVKIRINQSFTKYYHAIIESETIQLQIKDGVNTLKDR